MKILEGKRGLIFGALDEKSIAWKVAQNAHEQGAKFVLSNAPIALRMGKINELAEKNQCKIIIPLDCNVSSNSGGDPTYKLLELPITDNINDKKHFFWMSSSAFKYVNKTFPNIIDANHYCGPGNTYEEIKKIIKDPNKLRIALSYKDWKKNLLND